MSVLENLKDICISVFGQYKCGKSTFEFSHWIKKSRFTDTVIFPSGVKCHVSTLRGQAGDGAS